jgi:aerobic-type carbon monoxide dehydrogenase small subunit (CoxS/CutS family)
MTLAADVGARAVTTIERFAEGGRLHPVQAAFIEHDAMQCGFFTSGMILAATAQSPWGANVQTASSIEVRLHRDGSVEAFSSVQGIGSGVGTTIQQTIAETLGLKPS